MTLILIFLTADGDHLVYDFTASVSCQKTMDAQYVMVTFKNKKEQEKSARVDIPVIYGNVVHGIIGHSLFFFFLE